MTKNTLKITFKQRNDHQDAARERLRRAEAGESGDAIEQDVRYILNFEEFDDVDRLMRTSNLELIEAIVSEGPKVFDKQRLSSIEIIAKCIET
ncbi:hypothetical protein JCM18750_18710 [Halostagnicola bangensis]